MPITVLQADLSLNLYLESSSSTHLRSTRRQTVKITTQLVIPPAYNLLIEEKSSRIIIKSRNLSLFLKGVTYVWIEE